MMEMRIVIIDNYDSFTYNLVSLVHEVAGIRPEVLRNDQFELGALDVFDKIILSPGPGLPADAGLLLPVIKTYADKKSILGVCLGHQAIGEVFGAKLKNIERVFHGVATPARRLLPDPLFDGIDESFEIGRYHSWVIDPASLPSELEVLAIDDEGSIMAIRHRNLDIKGVQFHPESILTPTGKQLMENWLNS